MMERPTSIVWRLILLVLIFFLGYFGFYSYSNLKIAQSGFESSERQKVDILVGIIEPMLGTNISFGFMDSVESYMDGVHRSNTQIAGSRVSDMYGKTLYERNFTLQKYTDNPHFIYRKEPIRDPITTTTIGMLEIAYSNKNYILLEKEFENFTVLSLLVLLVLSGLLGWIVSESLKPLSRLAAQIKAYSHDNENFKVSRKKGSDEIAVIQNAVADFVESIKSYTSNLAGMNMTLEQKVAERTLELQQANEAKTIFLSNMTHEIRTPMNAIMGYAQLLDMDKTLTAKQKKAVATIVGSSEHLLELINDILDIAKIEAGKMELSISPFDIGIMLDSIREMFEDAAAKQGIFWSLEIDKECRYQVEADKGKLFRTLVNLVGNAIKFTPEGGKVTLRCSCSQDDIYRFEVIDTGIGIKDEDKDGIFNPFIQDREGSRLGGTGLGLSIVRNNLSLMGSSIRLDSTLNVGSRFYFDLKLPKAQGGRRSAVQALESDKAVAITFENLRFLIVDDQPENRDVLSKLLERLDIVCDTAKSGKEAIEKAVLNNYDGIFMDIKMPMMSGIEATQHIRELGVKSKIFAITTSTLYVKNDMDKALFERIVLKPFNIKDIYAMLHEFFGSKAKKAEPTPIDLPQSNDTNDALIDIDDEMRDEIIRQANLGRISTLKELLENIESNPLRLRLLDLLDEFDMDSIVALLTNKTDRQG